MSGWREQLDAVVGAGHRLDALSGGCVGAVHLVRCADGTRLVAKLDERGGTGGLEVEAAMLRYLREHTELPVPEVVHASPELLLMTFIAGRTGCGAAAEPHAAELLARLHAHRAARCGFDFDTRIGGLVQPNPWCEGWLAFFAEHRLLAMARQAVEAGRLEQSLARRVERLAGRLSTWLDEPEAPALLHGDVWSGNVLTEGGRVTGFVDPAIHFGHPEVELAFATLFSTFTDRFFVEYGRRTRRLDDDFFEVRRHVYNVYPLLVHVRLFGGAYAADLRSVLERFA